MMVGDQEERPTAGKLPRTQSSGLLTLDQRNSSSDIFVSISGLIGRYLTNLYIRFRACVVLILSTSFISVTTVFSASPVTPQVLVRPPWQPSLLRR